MCCELNKEKNVDMEREEGERVVWKAWQQLLVVDRLTKIELLYFYFVYPWKSKKLVDVLILKSYSSGQSAHARTYFLARNLEHDSKKK